MAALTAPVDARWGAPQAWLHVVVDGTDAALSWMVEQLSELRPLIPFATQRAERPG